MKKGAVKNESFLQLLFRGVEKMRKMNKQSQNKAFSLILGYPTAYKGTPRARFVYSINRKNAVFAILLHFFMF